MKEGAGRAVLVVDDDPALRMLCRVNRELGGYTVLSKPFALEELSTVVRELAVR